MKLCKSLFSVAIWSVVAGAARAQTVVADYQGNFATGGTPASGWSYQASTLANLGNSAAYVNLVHTTNNGGDYETPQIGGNGTLNPSAAQTSVFPGTPSSQDEYVVLGYTFTAQQIAADGNDLKFHTYDFSNPANSATTIDVGIYKSNTAIIPAGIYDFPAGTSFSDGVYGGDYDFGTVTAGQTLYIAIGATSNNYTGVPIGVAYTLALAPEPTSAAMFGVVAAGC